MSDVRKVTNQLIDLVDDGVLDWETVAMACLSYMSENDVTDMAQYNYLIEDSEDSE